MLRLGGSLLGGYGEAFNGGSDGFLGFGMFSWDFIVFLSYVFFGVCMFSWGLHSLLGVRSDLRFVCGFPDAFWGFPKGWFQFRFFEDFLWFVQWIGICLKRLYVL